jgi:hypothetical protein
MDDHGSDKGQHVGQADDERLEGLSALEQPDAELSALLDGELDAAGASALRARIAADPMFAARLAELGEVDSRLGSLAAEPASDDQLARIRVGLDRRLAEAGGNVISLRRPARLLAPVVAALAAALALYVAVGDSPESDPNAGRQDQIAPPLVAHTPDTMLEDSAPSRLRDAREASPWPATPDAASDEEVAILLEYEMLADFVVIENLDLLERLTELESTESM